MENEKGWYMTFSYNKVYDMEYVSKGGRIIYYIRYSRDSTTVISYGEACFTLNTLSCHYRKIILLDILMGHP